MGRNGHNFRRIASLQVYRNRMQVDGQNRRIRNRSVFTLGRAIRLDFESVHSYSHFLPCFFFSFLGADIHVRKQVITSVLCNAKIRKTD